MKPLIWGIFVLASASANAHAEPIKKGRVMCEGPSCVSQDVPTGSFIDQAENFVDDFKDRVNRRLDIAKKVEPEKAATKTTKERKSDRIHTRQAKSIAVSVTSKDEPVTNLPRYYQGIDRTGIEASEKVVFVPKSSDPRLKGLRSGDIVWAVVDQEIVASPSVPTPIRAMAIKGPFKGAYFVGEATLDRELKRILFSFTKLRLKDRDGIYAVKASGLSPRGSIGLEGEYVSQTGMFFVAELASAAAAGFVDSTVTRNQTAFGTYVQEPSLANSGKVAAATALSKTTDRMAEAVRNAPEYTKIPGYQEIQVIIQDDPTETGSP